MKLVLLFLIFLGISISPIFSSEDESPVLKKILELYKRKDYREIRKLATDYIEITNDLKQDDKVLKFYFHTETDLERLDIVLDKIYKNTDELSSKFSTLNYILLEKALLAEQYNIGVKWGEIFKKEARSKKPRYAKGLYLYACLLYKADKKKYSLSMINKALKERPSKKLTHKLILLRLSQLKNDFQVIIESKNFLRNNYDSYYADFIFVNMIQAYRNKGKKRRVEHLKEDFRRDFGDSMLIDLVTGI